MQSPRDAGEKGARDDKDPVDYAMQELTKELAKGQAMFLKGVRLLQQNVDRKYEQAMRQKEENRKAKETLDQREQEEEILAKDSLRFKASIGVIRQNLRLYGLRAHNVLQWAALKLWEKDDAIRGLQERLETQEGETAVEERTSTTEGSEERRDTQGLEGSTEKVEAFLKLNILSKLKAALELLQKPRAFSGTAASPSAASSRGSPATGVGEEPPSPQTDPAYSFPSPVCPLDAFLDAMTEEERRERQSVEVRIGEVKKRIEEARNSPSPAGEQLRDTAQEGKLNVVRQLIDSGADINYVDREGYTPLLKAVLSAQADVTSFLLERGADVNAVDRNGFSVLHRAAMIIRCGECVKLLLGAGCDINAKNKDGMTALHVAVMFFNVDTVRTLIAAGARTDIKPWSGFCKNKMPLEVAKHKEIRSLFRSIRTQKVSLRQ